MAVPPIEEGTLIDRSIKTPAEAASGQRTAKKALELLCKSDPSFVVPSAKQRKAIITAFVMADKVVYRRAFDVVKGEGKVNLDDSADILRNLGRLLICEIKSTAKASVKPNFKGYFCSISTAEVLVAQSLGSNYRFIFVNTVTHEVSKPMTLRDMFARAKAIYPTWSVAF
jgi:hypothetical protein